MPFPRVNLSSMAALPPHGRAHHSQVDHLTGVVRGMRMTVAGDEHRSHTALRATWP